MTTELLMQPREGRPACLLVVGRPPGPAPVPPHAILGEMDVGPAGRPLWATFRRNSAFIQLFRRYMQGRLAARPRFLADAVVEPGNFVYVIDARKKRDSHVPWTDTVGWYASDTAGHPRPETFAYNDEYRWVTVDGEMSALLEDPELKKMIAGA